MRQSLEQELAISARTGDTARLITALEEGAPFVIDLVRNTGWHGDTGTGLVMTPLLQETIVLLRPPSDSDTICTNQ